MRIQTQQAPIPSQPEVVLSDGKFLSLFINLIVCTYYILFDLRLIVLSLNVFINWRFKSNI